MHGTAPLKQQQKKDEPSISEVAQDALEKANGDAVQATAIMHKRVTASPGLYRSLMDPLVKAACYDAISAACRKQRRAIWHTPQPSSAESKARVVALAGGTMSTLFDFPLPGGKRLGDAMREDVAAAAEFYSKQAQDMGAKATWLSRIVPLIPESKRVEDALTEAKLKKLQREALNHAA